ncbi:MAG: coagulation factor 5/8 type domain-containing protein [Verrucomicrobia bacterium]|nr:MAG: coagulation factor 5/8 type domain-containing protein [Verrucomicrobiota bacterium]
MNYSTASNRLFAIFYFLFPILPLLSALSPSPAFAADTIPIPQPAAILALLHKGHPRLLASSNDFSHLKAQFASNTELESWHKDIQSKAEQIITAQPSRYEIPDGLRLLATSRRVVDRIYILGLLYKLDGQQRCADRAWKELEAAANFPDWNTRHFLDTAEMTHAFAIGYDWFYEAWTPDQRSRVEHAMIEKGLKPALSLYRERRYWTRMKHNWNQVCNGGIGMGALALAEVEPQICGEILHDALESIQLAMAEFAPDGAWKEGPGYWNYATSYNVIFLAGLQSALGTDFGLSQFAGFSDTGLFPIYLTGPLGRTFNYADGGDREIRAPQMFWLARRFERPVFAGYERQVAAPAPLDLLWSVPGETTPKSVRLPLDKYFRGAEVAIFRSEWGNPKALFAGFKAGDNKANHSHLDLGSFVFDAQGARWVIDLGSDDYNLPGYFGAQRWNYYRLRAEGQNTLVLDPSPSPDQDPAASTRIIRFQSNPDRAFAIADLTPAYKKSAQKVWRGLALLDRDKLVVQDEIQSQKPADLWWFMHTPAAIKVEKDGRAAILQQAGARLRASILSPETAQFQIMDANPLPESPHPEKQARNDNIRKLAIHLPDIKETRLTVLLFPLTKEAKPSPQKLTLTDLSKW